MAMLWSLAVFAPASLLASDLPRGWAWPLALMLVAWAAFNASRYRLQPTRKLLVPAGRGQARCDGMGMLGLRVAWRGPLAFLRWRDADGRVQRASFWPDTLDAPSRRELRLALLRMETARDAASMAG